MGDCAGHKKPRRETLNLVFEIVKDAPEVLASDWHALDTKLATIFATASVALGLAVTSVPRDVDAAWVDWLFLGGATAAYALVGICAVFGLWPREFYRARHADVLAKEHLGDPPEEIKCLLIDRAADSYQRNKAILRRKARWLTAAIFLVLLEVLLAAVAVILSRA